MDGSWGALPGRRRPEALDSEHLSCLVGTVQKRAAGGSAARLSFHRLSNLSFAGRNVRLTPMAQGREVLAPARPWERGRPRPPNHAGGDDSAGEFVISFRRPA